MASTSRRYDLHLHSTASDGHLSPRDVVAVAVDRGLSGIALTDHDTVAGIPQAQAAAQALGIDFVPAIELSCRAPEHGAIHLLGYDIDPAAPSITGIESWQRAQRIVRAQGICERLAEHTGLSLMDEVLAEAGAAPVGRPHIARVMVRHNIVASVEQAFDEWFVAGRPAFVLPSIYRLADGIAAIHEAGGVAVLAHPSRWRPTGPMLGIAAEAVAAGLDGVEVDHPHHDSDALEAWAGFAHTHGLIQTAGSDDHGDDGSAGRIGARTVPEQVVEEIRQRAAAYR